MSLSGNGNSTPPMPADKTHRQAKSKAGWSGSSHWWPTGGDFVGLTVFCLIPHAQRSRCQFCDWADALFQSSPTLLCHGISTTLSHYGGTRLPEWTSHTTSSDNTVTKSKTGKKSVRTDMERAMLQTFFTYLFLRYVGFIGMFAVTSL